MGELKHIGVPRRSGRYPWGSGDNPNQRNPSFRDQVRDLKKKGMTEKEIAEGFGMKTTQLRAEISLEKAEQRKADSALAQRLKDKGYSNIEIGKRMGINESSVRNLLDPVMQERALITEQTANMLKNQVNEKKYLDVGAGVENHIGVSRTKLNTAIAELEKEGYKLQYIQVEQLGTGKKTTIKVLTKEDTPYSEIYKNKDQIRTVTDWTQDGGRTYSKIQPPINISKERILINYAEDGGSNKDGVIELRRGKEDISLGESKYAQVRIAVDGTHYMKGMAIYADDLPDGIDIRYNTNKSKGTPPLGPKDNTVLKIQETGKVNPFNAEIYQKNYIGKDGKEHLSPINIVNEEGKWSDWSKTLSSQFLSKQPASLAKEQLNLAFKLKEEEFNEYNSYTNPTVKKRLLLSFADDCDSSAVHLKGASLPRQGTHVILPSLDLKPSEIYAPNYKDGETVVLIRHPHGGIFEIPQLTVNNKNPKAKSIFGKAIDAVAIHPDVAKKLSGADFDGDTVLVIPNNNKSIKISPSLKSLSDFDPKTSYPGFPGMKSMTSGNKQTEMGKISNLITDMTIKGASQDEIARAVKHSMVVIDAEKHNLNYKQSYLDNNIAELKKIYQGGSTRGASTLISKSKSEMRIPKRKDTYLIDPQTGKKIFVQTPETYTNKKGKIVDKKTLTTKMYETDDALTLSSGTRMESIYGEYANSLKSLGDKARKIAINTPPLIYSPSARKTYSNEVESLKSKLFIAKSNKPMERQAQLLANKIVSSKRHDNPSLTPKDIKKIKGQALVDSRYRTGAKKINIDITSKEWEAIQAGAISNNVLMDILVNTKLELIKQYATPKTKKGISHTKLLRAKSMLNKGYTQAEIAEMLGVSSTTLMNSLKDEMNN